MLARDTGESGGTFGITMSMIQVNVRGRVEEIVKSDKEMSVTPCEDLYV